LGRIITISGKNEPEKHPGKINIAMSAKAALHAWSKGLSNEVAHHGVTVNCLGPGKIMSEQIRKNYDEECIFKFTVGTLRYRCGHSGRWKFS